MSRGRVCLFSGPDNQTLDFAGQFDQLDQPLISPRLLLLKRTAGSMDESPPSRIYVEQTLALIKPDVVHIADEIEGEILKSGFTILQVSSNVLVTHMPR